MTFNPNSPAIPTSATIDMGVVLLGVACPSTSQCTALDSSGQQVTFDPTAPGSPTPTAIDPTKTLTAVACPSISQCVAVNGEGAEMTFDPRASGTPTATLVDAGATRLFGVACPSVSQCTAVAGAGAEVTFNPSDPGSPLSMTVDRGRPGDQPAITGVACTSATQCVGVDNTGTVVTFDPATPNIATLATIDSGRILFAVTCPAASECVAVDQAGGAFLGNPGNPYSWTRQPITAPASLTSAACATAAECALVDSQGNVFVGITAPVSLSPPSASGSAVQGQTLTDEHGSWSPSPSGYAYQWQRCDRTGNGCEAISDAAGPTYTLTSSDVGTTIRVQETASDTAGAGAPTTSNQTAVVVEAASPGGVSSGSGHPRVTGFRVTNSPFVVSEAHTPIIATAAAAKRHDKFGTTFKYALSEMATVKIAVFERLAGQRGRKRCVSLGRGIGHTRACARMILAGTLIRSSHRGADSVAFSGRIGSKALKPGYYQATLTATDGARRNSKPTTTSFMVVASGKRNL